MVRNRGLALLLLLLTLAPLVIWAILISSIALTSNGSLPVNESAELPEPLMQGMLLAVMITLGLMVFYLVHLFGSGGPRSPIRAIWLVGIVFLNIFVMPFYWYHYVWPRRQAGAA